MNIETNKDIPRELDTQEIQEKTSKELNNLKQDIDPEKINIEEEIKKIPVPEYYKQYYAEQRTQEQIINSYHGYTDIVYAKHFEYSFRGNDTDEEHKSIYWEDDRTNIERFFTLEDKIQQMENMLAIKIDRNKLLTGIINSSSLSEFFRNKRERAHVNFPFADKPEEKIVKKDSE